MMWLVVGEVIHPCQMWSLPQIIVIKQWESMSIKVYQYKGKVQYEVVFAVVLFKNGIKHQSLK